jgi:hypothetical protein
MPEPLPRLGRALPQLRKPPLDPLLLFVGYESQASGTLALSPSRTPARSRLELETDEPLVADHARVVAGLNDVRLARTDLDLDPVLVLDGQPAGANNADMASLAALIPATA